MKPAVKSLTFFNVYLMDVNQRASLIMTRIAMSFASFDKTRIYDIEKSTKNQNRQNYRSNHLNSFFRKLSFSINSLGWTLDNQSVSKNQNANGYA